MSAKSIIINDQAYTEDGYIINSDFLNDLNTEDAKKIIIQKIEEKNTISNLQKENLGKIGHLQTYSSPKITSSVGIKNENATIQAPVFLKKVGFNLSFFSLNIS